MITLIDFLISEVLMLGLISMVIMWFSIILNTDHSYDANSQGDYQNTEKGSAESKMLQIACPAIVEHIQDSGIQAPKEQESFTSIPVTIIQTVIVRDENEIVELTLSDYIGLSFNNDLPNEAYAIEPVIEIKQDIIDVLSFEMRFGENEEKSSGLYIN